MPDCTRHFFSICEIGSPLGLVPEIDMDRINQEEIKIKVGVRDIYKTPEFIEITTKDLYLFDVFFPSTLLLSKAGITVITKDRTLWVL